MLKNLIPAIIIMVLSATSCKTSEANYRAAYEQAAQARRDRTSDDTSTGSRFQTSDPVVALASGDKMPLRRQRVKIESLGGDESLAPYHMIAAGFKQRFNARSLATRLRQRGIPAVVVYTGEPYYFISVAQSDDKDALAASLQAVEATGIVPAADGYPFILSPVR